MFSPVLRYESEQFGLVKVPLTGNARDVGVRGRQAPWVVTKEVGKRRRRSSADAAPGDLTILQVRSGFAPISAHLICEEHFLCVSFRFVFFFGRQATGNGGTPSSMTWLLGDSP